MESETTVQAGYSSEAIVPDEEMRQLAFESLNYANSYFSTFSKSVENEHSRFDNDLLYQMAIMCVEKYFVALLARYDQHASHHMPVAMYKEALQFDPGLTDEMKKTAIIVGKFEGICSVDGFGYKTPTKDDLKVMKAGIDDIKALVEKRLADI
ncbi:MAG TPA: hypothetical protein VK152_04325 [Paludibacter sp.]|nr:hypothetical protein [Paludibacter sp.]